MSPKGQREKGSTYVGQRQVETMVTRQRAQQQEEGQHTGRGQVEVTQVGR